MEKTTVRRISPDDGNYFFGYYDLPAFSKDNKLHLAHKCDFIDRLQKKGDSIELGIIESEGGKYHPLGRTNAWNFQQGSMLQWNPKNPSREIIYNDYIDGEYVAVIMDIENGRKRYIERPVANVSKDGKYALSINFSRLIDFRPGYGYACEEDRFFNVNHPSDDGVWLIDMESGKSKLIISLDEIWNLTGAYFDKDQKLNINHITFNPDASRFFFITRNFPTDKRIYRSVTLTANRDGSGIFMLSDYGYMSHYYWMNNEDIILFGDLKEVSGERNKPRNFIIKDKTHDGHLFDENDFFEDNHMSFSPDRRLLISDTYPDADGNQSLRLYDMGTRKNTLIGKFRSMKFDIIDLRCDLHPRWNAAGTAVSFDSTHEMYRGIYIAENLPILTN